MLTQVKEGTAQVFRVKRSKGSSAKFFVALGQAEHLAYSPYLLGCGWKHAVKYFFYGRMCGGTCKSEIRVVNLYLQTVHSTKQDPAHRI